MECNRELNIKIGIGDSGEIFLQTFRFHGYIYYCIIQSDRVLVTSVVMYQNSEDVQIDLQTHLQQKQ